MSWQFGLDSAGIVLLVSAELTHVGDELLIHWQVTVEQASL